MRVAGGRTQRPPTTARAPQLKYTNASTSMRGCPAVPRFLTRITCLADDVNVRPNTIVAKLVVALFVLTLTGVVASICTAAVPRFDALVDTHAICVPMNVNFAARPLADE